MRWIWTYIFIIWGKSNTRQMTGVQDINRMIWGGFCLGNQDFKQKICLFCSAWCTVISAKLSQASRLYFFSSFCLVLHVNQQIMCWWLRVEINVESEVTEQWKDHRHFIGGKWLSLYTLTRNLNTIINFYLTYHFKCL